MRMPCKSWWIVHRDSQRDLTAGTLLHAAACHTCQSVSACLSLSRSLQVIPSRGVKVAGLLGPAAPIEKKSAHIADVPVGIGGTTMWKLAGLVRAAAHPCLPLSALPPSQLTPRAVSSL
jgi:hypothetical protein